MIIYNCHTHTITTNQIPLKSISHFFASIKKAERGNQLSNKVTRLSQRKLVVRYLNFIRFYNEEFISNKATSYKILNPPQHLAIAKITENGILTFSELCEKTPICKN